MGEITGTLPCTLRQARRWRARAHMIGIRRKNHTRGFPFLWPRAVPFVPWDTAFVVATVEWCRTIDHFRRDGLCRSYPNVSFRGSNSKRMNIESAGELAHGPSPHPPTGMDGRY